MQSVSQQISQHLSTAALSAYANPSNVHLQSLVATLRRAHVFVQYVQLPSSFTLDYSFDVLLDQPSILCRAHSTASLSAVQLVDLVASIGLHVFGSTSAQPVVSSYIIDDPDYDPSPVMRSVSFNNDQVLVAINTDQSVTIHIN